MKIIKKTIITFLFSIAVFIGCSDSINESENINSVIGKATNGISIYFEKPSDWNEAWIWYDENSNNSWETTTLRQAPGDMVNIELRVVLTGIKKIYQILVQ